jgi:hypothetical protein
MHVFDDDGGGELEVEESGLRVVASENTGERRALALFASFGVTASL